MLKKWINDWRFTRVLTIVAPVAMTVWFFGGAPGPAVGFFALGASYGVLLFRVVSLSVRASMVMGGAFTLILIVMLRMEDISGIPMEGPALMGFIAGGIAGGHRWSGKKAGSEIRRKRERTADGGYTGGWQLALINAASAAVLLGAPTAMLLDGVTVQTLAVSLAIGFVGGWALVRFVKSFQTRFIILIAMFFAFIPALILAGFIGYVDAVFTGLFGFLAGSLIGGRYWWGPRFGAPRPPFAGKTKRRRKRKRKAKTTSSKRPVELSKVTA
ncbi:MULTISPECIES: hypothetical protein [Arthrobacter]|uniref:Uncharacterized protein n=1 Tax=Arthrobacter jinronghuae TaxID=2964609 RepID=A0ABT1NSA8_9MICC|nr:MULTISPECIES: hypothetical protein [Arthrobacter]MCQ1950613.1 hypothetical protein [Arthrobacter jinronghuae]MCQ1953936.1 hypothetical protein [Arthrobacter sp. zg-Y238]UWX79091.1 hypothetical protein N2K98_02440 [Arthrobacter jinronghuae]